MWASRITLAAGAALALALRLAETRAERGKTPAPEESGKKSF